MCSINNRGKGEFRAEGRRVGPVEAPSMAFGARGKEVPGRKGTRVHARPGGSPHPAGWGCSRRERYLVGTEEGG